MSSQPPSESPPASAPFFERVRDFLLGHPDHPDPPEQSDPPATAGGDSSSA